VAWAALHVGFKIDFKQWAEENGKAITNEVKDFFLSFLWQTSGPEHLFDIKFQLTLAITSFTAIDPGAEVVGVPFQGCGEIKLAKKQGHAGCEVHCGQNDKIFNLLFAARTGVEKEPRFIFLLRVFVYRFIHPWKNFGII